MIRTFARRAAAAAVPLITLPVLALAAAPGTAQASAPADTITMQSQAQLLADGHVVVTVGYTCNPGFSGPTGALLVEVTQRGIIDLATATAVCDDQRHTASIDVGPGPFTPGSATGFGEVASGGAAATTSAELKVS